MKNAHHSLNGNTLKWESNKRLREKFKRIIQVTSVIVLFHIFIISYHDRPKELDNIPVSTVSSQTTNILASTVINQPDSVSASVATKNATNSFESTVSKNKSRKTTNARNSTLRNLRGNVTYYELIKDFRYHYQFRFEINNNTDNDTRLMILLNGSVRTCVDYWDFAVGRRILAALRSFRFSILVICNKKRTYDLQTRVKTNADVMYIYHSLQKWMNDVYYKQFQYYPRLYIHGISRGSRIAGLLCRILPIQHQILTVHPGESHGMRTPSQYPTDLQRRLQLDSVFANWFYFDFCYKPTLNNETISQLCPFQSEKYYYQPVPPTYFIHLQNDRLFSLAEYTDLINFIRNNSFDLGGKLLNHTESVKLYVMPPSNATLTYMHETYDTWHSKPHASAIFYEHYVNQSLYIAKNKTRRTCPCLPIDFTYYERYPNITQKWPKQKQDDYKDYVDDIKRFLHSFCEDVCADLYTDHGMSSRNLDKALEWVDKIDALRHSLFVEDYVSRPLRIWMYNKTSIVNNNTYFASNPPDYVNIISEYHMYSPEYYLQNYFKQLQTSSDISRRNLQWAGNPLLADYFVIPSDLSYYYFYPDVNMLTRMNFEALVKELNTEYFEPLLANIRTKFPYWTMAKHADQHGSNHILTILTGRNMGLLFNDMQKILKNVVQIVFTGLRQDMLSSNTLPPLDYRGIPIIYRHGYDVVIPQFTRVISGSNRSLTISELVGKKKSLLFFAGALKHSVDWNSARRRLELLSNDMKKREFKMTEKRNDTPYDILVVIDGHQEPHEYVNSMQSTVFALCPEGFFPWSPRLYDALQLGAIPLILADNIVLPFERFIDWPSFTIKINVSNIENMIDLVQHINQLEKYITKKLSNTQQYADAFRWPYSSVGENGHEKHDFLPDEDKNGSARNPLHYLGLELRCRRLEQLYGLTSDSFSSKSISAQQQACTVHPSVCPCHNRNRTVAFREYF